VFSAKTTISDRKNAKSSIFIKRPYISVIGTIQKKILSELAKGERSSNGFIDRILFVMPNLQQKARWNDKELPENIEQEWNAIIDKLIQQIYLLTFDTEEVIFVSFRNQYRDVLIPNLTMNITPERHLQQSATIIVNVNKLFFLFLGTLSTTGGFLLFP
jgi:hypothetical protein